MLRISASTLSRQRLAGVRVGRREIRLPASTLLEAARANNWIPVESLARSLIDYTRGHCPEAAAEVAEQIGDWFADTPDKPALDREAFLTEAARALPAVLFKAILAYYGAAGAPAADDSVCGSETVLSATQEGGS